MSPITSTYIALWPLTIADTKFIPRLTFTPGSQDSRVPPADSEHNRELITVIAVRPFSRGSVHLNTTNPLDLPSIDPNFLELTEFGEYQKARNRFDRN